MTWREVLVARLVLLIARMVADDPVLREELKNISTHISVHGEKALAEK